MTWGTPRSAIPARPPWRGAWPAAAASMSASAQVAAQYRHNEQSLRVVERIENDGRGLNLTAEVRDGILHHTGAIRAETLEGRIVATADRIAYVNHDIDDAIRAGLLTEDALPASTHEVLGADHSSRIELLVRDMVQTSAAARRYRAVAAGMGCHERAAKLPVRQRLHRARRCCWK